VSRPRTPPWMRHELDAIAMRHDLAALEHFDAIAARPDHVPVAPVDQPPPIPRSTRPVWDLVIEDMKERNRVGTLRYGTPLQVHNGRDALVDAYQEALDLVVYLRQEIEERSS